MTGMEILMAKIIGFLNTILVGKVVKMDIKFIVQKVEVIVGMGQAASMINKLLFI